MTAREPAKVVDEEAAAWTARIDRGLDFAEQAALDHWLAGDRRRIGALARAKAIWVHAEQAVSLEPLLAVPPAGESIDASPSPRTLSRRNALIGGGALAAGLVAAVAAPAFLRRPTVLASGVGEIRRVPLGDGSVVTLDTDSAIEVRFGDAARTVRLRSGGAFFEIVADRLRPFLVETGNVILHATSSAFSVDAIAGLPLSILVSRGHVEITGKDSPHPVVLAANMRATMRAGEKRADAIELRPIAPEEVDRALSWRSGMLAFEGETLAAAAAMFRRYGGPAIEVPDPALARAPITGLFAATDPAGFARAIALSLGARVETDGDAIRLSPVARTG